MAGTLACLRSYEGDYTTETGNGYSGAYQYTPGTWRWAVTGAAEAAGDDDMGSWAASRASSAPAWVQDQATAWALAQPGGPANWPTMRHCRG